MKPILLNRTMDLESCCGPDLIRGTNISRTTFREVDSEYLERSVSWHYRGLLRGNGSCWTVVERLEVLPLLWVSWKGNLVTRLTCFVENACVHRTLSYLISVNDKTVKLRRYFILNVHAWVFIPRLFRKVFSDLRILDWRKFQVWN